MSVTIHVGSKHYFWYSVVTTYSLSWDSFDRGEIKMETPSMESLLRILYLDSDNPDAFENNFDIPEKDFPAAKQKIVLLAYSRWKSSFLSALYPILFSLLF